MLWKVLLWVNLYHFVLAIACAKTSQIFSNIFRSRNWAGLWIIRISLSWNYCLVTSDVWAYCLSSKKIQTGRQRYWLVIKTNLYYMEGATGFWYIRYIITKPTRGLHQYCHCWWQITRTKTNHQIDSKNSNIVFVIMCVALKNWKMTNQGKVV